MIHWINMTSLRKVQGKYHEKSMHEFQLFCLHVLKWTSVLIPPSTNFFKFPSKPYTINSSCLLSTWYTGQKNKKKYTWPLTSKSIQKPGGNQSSTNTWITTNSKTPTRKKTRSELAVSGHTQQGPCVREDLGRTMHRNCTESLNTKSKHLSRTACTGFTRAHMVIFTHREGVCAPFLAPFLISILTLDKKNWKRQKF